MVERLGSLRISKRSAQKQNNPQKLDKTAAELQMKRIHSERHEAVFEPLE
jgi:hypothetical protein